MSENKWKKRIHYVLKAAKHFGDEPYMDFFLEREVNPLLLEFKQNGSGVPPLTSSTAYALFPQM